MKLILTRHGETEENIKGIIQGHLPGRLSKKGIEQAKKVAQRLKHEKIDAIYSSDLKRAADTTKEIAKYHPNIPLIFTEELRERNHGSLTGQKKKNIDWKKYTPDGETPETMKLRLKKIIDDAYSEYPDGTVLFVGHGTMSRMILTIIENNPIEEWESQIGLKNTSVSIFEIKEDENHEIILLNSTSHLGLPSHKECLDWYKENNTPENIIRHVKKVNQVATFLAKKLIEKGIDIDYDLVDRASLLHDLDKWFCIKDPKIRHGYMTKEILTKKGYPELGELAKNHIPKEIYDRETSWEENLIVYSDSRVEKDKIVSQEQRINDALKRYKIPEDICKREIIFSKKIEKKIFKHLDINPKDLEKLNN